MWKVLVVVVDPFAQSDFKFKRAFPVIAPDNAFFDGAHDSLGIGVAFGVGPS